jgi:2-keto-3-deoxy-6-phosphogluconate aldolase
MDKAKITKYVMLGLGAALTLGANLVNAKNQDDKMKETIAEKVAEALEQAKES